MEKTTRETELLFVQGLRKIQNISNLLSRYLQGLQWTSIMGAERFLLEQPFVLGSDAHLCNCRFPSHGQRIEHQHWGACFCTEPTGPLGKQHALGPKQSWVYPSLPPPTS